MTRDDNGLRQGITRDDVDHYGGQGMTMDD